MLIRKSLNERNAVIFVPKHYQLQSSEYIQIYSTIVCVRKMSSMCCMENVHKWTLQAQQWWYEIELLYAGKCAMHICLFR